MIIHLDTSALVDALTGPRRSLDPLIDLTDRGHRLGLSTIVLYEWLRGPRTRAELAVQEELFPSELATAFGSSEAAMESRGCVDGAGVPMKLPFVTAASNCARQGNGQKPARRHVVSLRRPG